MGGEPAARASGAQLRPSLAGRRLGRYEVLTQLASGGMGGVYVARAQGVAGFERLVAIKVLHPHLAHEEEFISMFLDEARLAARIRHPNVVPTLDVSDTEGAGYFIVMDYVEGDHLGALLRASAHAGQRLPEPVVVRILMDALAGLAAAHGLVDERGDPLNLVHRDVSPHNIMVGKDGVSRLTDFGVAKAEVRLSSTREGQFKGKLSYMAPEHASTGDADQRSDIFSMGIILWECLAGRRLFKGENNAATLNLVLSEPIVPISSFSPSLTHFDPVLERALARPPRDRYQTADDFLDALEQAGRQAQGVGTLRMVATVVKNLVGDKMREEAERVRHAIDDLGHADLRDVLLPLPAEGSGSHVSMPPAHDPEARTRAERPSARPEMPPRPRLGLSVAVGAAAFILLVAAAVATLVSLAPWNTEGGDRTPMAAPAPPNAPTPAQTPATGEAGAAEAVPAGAAPVEGPEDEAEGAGARPAGTPPAGDSKTRMGGSRPRPPTQMGGGEDDLLSNPYRQ